MIFLGIKYEPLSDPPVIKICEWGPWAPIFSSDTNPGIRSLLFHEIHPYHQTAILPSDLTLPSAPHLAISPPILPSDRHLIIRPPPYHQTAILPSDPTLPSDPHHTIRPPPNHQPPTLAGEP